jgi:SAM-dependent methyltransferase
LRLSDQDYIRQQRRRSKPGEYKSIRRRVDAALRWMTEQIPAAALLGKRGLDAGTRDGYALEAFRRLGIAEAGGIELVPETAAYAARRGRAVRQGDMRSLPDPDESWDLVTCIHCLEHCPEPARAVGELARLLRPGGWLFLAVPREPSGDSDPVHNWAFPDAECLRGLVLGVQQFDPATLREQTGTLARGRRELRLLIQKRKSEAPAAKGGT